MSTKYVKSIDPRAAADWDLVLVLAHWSNKPLDVPYPVQHRLYKLIWAETDAYGPKGYIPPQGYDWSGIRDSTPAAVVAMAKAARAELLRMGIHSIRYEHTTL